MTSLIHLLCRSKTRQTAHWNTNDFTLKAGFNPRVLEIAL